MREGIFEQAEDEGWVKTEWCVCVTQKSWPSPHHHIPTLYGLLSRNWIIHYPQVQAAHSPEDRRLQRGDGTDTPTSSQQDRRDHHGRLS